jgi:hypothetical protein
MFRTLSALRHAGAASVLQTSDDATDSAARQLLAEIAPLNGSGAPGITPLRSTGGHSIGTGQAVLGGR